MATDDEPPPPRQLERLGAMACEVLGQPELDAALVVATVIGTGLAVPVTVLTVLLTAMTMQARALHARLDEVQRHLAERLEAGQSLAPPASDNRVFR